MSLRRKSGVVAALALSAYLLSPVVCNAAGFLSGEPADTYNKLDVLERAKEKVSLDSLKKHYMPEPGIEYVKGDSLIAFLNEGKLNVQGETDLSISYPANKETANIGGFLNCSGGKAYFGGPTAISVADLKTGSNLYSDIRHGERENNSVGSLPPVKGCTAALGIESAAPDGLNYVEFKDSLTLKASSKNSNRFRTFGVLLNAGPRSILSPDKSGGVCWAAVPGR